MPEPIVLDSALHKALREMVTGIAAEHGIYVMDVRVTWYEEQMIAEASPTYRLRSIDVQTRSI